MKRHAPAAARNSEPIAQVLEKDLPETGLVLEIASGTGEHVVFMARRFPALEWQPSDADIDALASIAGWADEAALPNLRSPIKLDASAADWPIEAADAQLCINMVHISPWSASEGLFAGASRLLASSAPLILYGPFFEERTDPAPSNVAFDQSLRSRNASWGIRQVERIDDLAESCGFFRSARHEMPANNLTLVYRRT